MTKSDLSNQIQDSRMRRILLLIQTILLGILLAAGQFRQAAYAQAISGTGWSDPINLSQSENTSSSPVVTADIYGYVHVFWSEDLDQEVQGGAAPGAGNAIMYRRLANGLWTDAVDLAYGRSTAILHSPAAVSTADGYVHLVWIQNFTIQYSSAPGWDAHRVKAWSLPVELAQGQIGRVRLLDLGEGQLIAIYTILFGRDAGLYAVRFSQDSVDLPVNIWTGPSGFAPQDIGAAVDQRGRLHVVWSVAQPPSPAAVEVQYANSLDGGLTWSNNQSIVTQTSAQDGLQFAVPWVAARGEDEIHLQWAQGERAYRWHQYSTDGGENWSQRYQIWPDLLSQTNSQATVVDSSGTLYWLDVLRFPNGMYLIRWGGNAWQTPEMFFEIESVTSEAASERINAHALRATISSGNQLHLVFQDQDRAEIWYMSRTLPSGAVPTEAPPAPTHMIPATVTPQPAAATEASSIPVNSITPAPPYDDNELMSQPGVITLMGVFPVFLLVSIIVLISFRKKI